MSEQEKRSGWVFPDQPGVVGMVGAGRAEEIAEKIASGGQTASGKDDPKCPKGNTLAEKNKE